MFHFVETKRVSSNMVKNCHVMVVTRKARNVIVIVIVIVTRYITGGRNVIVIVTCLYNWWPECYCYAECYVIQLYAQRRSN